MQKDNTTVDKILKGKRCFFVPPDSDRTGDLRAKAETIRGEVGRVAIANGAGHIAPSLSCVDILTALYYDVMRYDPKRPGWEDRDRLIFSKGHGCYALYAILADLGTLPREQWERFYTAGSELAGCVERRAEWGLEAGCGSLGHGLPMAVGVAMGAKLQGRGYHTYCIVGDGEMQEGTNWEAIQFAVKHGLDNLTILIDQNGLQAMDTIVNILGRGRDDLAAGLRGFGLSPVVANGHDAEGLAGAIRDSKNTSDGVPGVFIAETVKGYGLKCMESIVKFHFRVPPCGQVGL
jgi:transketolase